MRRNTISAALALALILAPAASAVTFTFDTPIAGDRVPVTAELRNASEGDAVDVRLAVPPGAGDLLGFFGNVAADELAGDTRIVPDMSVVADPEVIPEAVFDANRVDAAGPGNNLRPVRDWDFGLRIGEPGKGRSAVEEATFRLVGPGLSVERLLGAANEGWLLGVRVQSTGGTEGSAKIGLAVGVPRVRVESPAAGAFLAESPVRVEGTVEPQGTSVAVDGVAATVDGSAYFASVALEEGSDTLTVTASNTAGSTSVERSVHLDTIAPEVAIASPEDGLRTAAEEIVVAGTVADASPIEELGVGTEPAELADGAFEATTPLGLGESSVQVFAADAAGNIGSASVTVVRGRAPEIAVLSPGAGSLVRVPEVEIRGTVTGEPGSVEVAGQQAALDGEVFTALVPLSEGLNTLSLTATNEFGTSQGTLTVERRLPPRVTVTSPAAMTRFASSPISVTGTVDEPDAVVEVEGVVVPLEAGDPATFTAQVPLQEGSNLITVKATDSTGEVGAQTLPVVLDTEPPRVVIDSPPNGATLTEQTVDVSGMVNDVTLGRIEGTPASVEIAGIEAQVTNSSFSIPDVPLSPGENTLTATAEDAAGNVSSTSIGVTVEDVSGEPRIRRVSGSNQVGTISSVLDEPLVVELLDGSGQPVAGEPVVFRVVEDTGLVTGGDDSGRAVAVTTDGSGRASVTWSLGMRAGPGTQRIEAGAAGYEGRAVFTATSLPGAPANIVVDSGNGQRGVVGQLLPQPLNVVVTDAGNNRLPDVPVTFTVVDGGGSFDGQSQITVPTDPRGSASAQLTLGPGTTPEANRVEVDFPGNPGVPAHFLASGVLPGDPAETRLSGVVLDNTDEPIPGVTLRIEGTDLTATADGQGQFAFTGVPVGDLHLIADGSTAERPGTWPTLTYEVVALPGHGNALGRPVYLLPLDVPNGVFVDETTGGRVTLKNVPGFALDVAPGSATFPDGSKSGVVSVTQVHSDKIPRTPNFGQQPQLIVTIQPSGTKFDPPARLTLPNVDGLVPGEVTELYSFDHDLGRFVGIGPGTVSEDGLVVQSNPGVGILEGGWHCGGNPAEQGTCCDCSDCETCDESQGTCLPETGNSCDDGMFCTSISGTEPGPDQCENGSCLGNPIPDKDLVDVTPQEYDLTKLRQLIQGTAEAANLAPGCEVTPPQINGGLKISFFERCCEDLQSIEQGEKLSGFVSVSAIGAECIIPGLSFTIPKILEGGVFVGVALKGSFSGGGTQSPCDGDCNTFIKGSLGAELRGGVKVQTLIDPDIISVSLAVKGSGTIEATLECGDASASGCVGPPAISGEVVLGGFIKKSVDVVPFPDLKACV